MQLSPKKTPEPERFLLYEGSHNSLIVPSILNLIKKDNISICDVGGASGKLLKEIVVKSNFKIKQMIMDIDDFYKELEKEVENGRIKKLRRKRDLFLEVEE